MLLLSLIKSKARLRHGSLIIFRRVETMSLGQLGTALHTFGCSTFKRKQGGLPSTTVPRVQKGKISVQPEYVKRKKNVDRGKKELLKGGHT